MATAVSHMRLEKPHSLSYQERTRTSVPSITLVWSIAKLEECGSWLKSAETFGSRVKSRMPLSSWLAARSMAPLTSSVVVGRLVTILKSMTDTLGVGTRMATPSSLPLSSGSTRPTALAAPVDRSEERRVGKEGRGGLVPEDVGREA